MEFDAVVLAGGRAERLGGADKAAVVVGGLTLLDRALAAVADARRVVVVGDERPTRRPVLWARERPPYGGPVAATYAGLDALGFGSPGHLGPDTSARRTQTQGTIGQAQLVVLLAVDMPEVTAGTVERLVDGTGGYDGAVLTRDGRRHLAMAAWAGALARVRPDPVDGAAMRGLWEALDLADVVAAQAEARDVDTWADIGTEPPS